MQAILAVTLPFFAIVGVLLLGYLYFQLAEAVAELAGVPEPA